MTDERYNRFRKISHNLSIQEKVSHIKDQIENSIENCTLEIYVRDKTTHDRLILTNLFLIKRAAGLNIFDGSNEIRDISEIDTHFIFLSTYCKPSKIRRNKIDQIINSSERIDTKDGNLETYTSWV